MFLRSCVFLCVLQVPRQSGGNVGGVVCACATIQHSRASTWLTAGTDIGFFGKFITFLEQKAHFQILRESAVTLEFLKKITIQSPLCFVEELK